MLFRYVRDPGKPSPGPALLKGKLFCTFPFASAHLIALPCLFQEEFSASWCKIAQQSRFDLAGFLPLVR